MFFAGFTSNLVIQLCDIHLNEEWNWNSIQISFSPDDKYVSQKNPNLGVLALMSRNSTL